MGGKTVNGLMSSFCSHISLGVDKLLKIAFGIRGFSRKEIAACLARSDELVSRGEGRHHLDDDSKFGGSGESLKTLRSGVSHAPHHGMVVDPHFRHDDSHAQSVLVHVLQQVWHWLPIRITLLQPVLLFTSEEDGTSLVTFFSRVDNNEPTLLLVKTHNNEVFGAYCSSDWANRHRHDPSTYFGTGETFLFSIHPHLRKYGWVGGKSGDAHMFMATQLNYIMIGGGRGFGLELGDTLQRGRSQACDTFDNPPLATGGDFRCRVVEVFGFALN